MQNDLIERNYRSLVSRTRKINNNSLPKQIINNRAATTIILYKLYTFHRQITTWLHVTG